MIVIDFETRRRQRDLSNSQPLQINWHFVGGWAFALLFSLLVWRGGYLLFRNWHPLPLLIDNALRFWQAADYYTGSTLRFGLVVLAVGFLASSIMAIREALR